MISSGAQIGKYRLGKKLGQGGFGVVFLAHDTSLDREVALKFLNPEHTSTPQILQRFLQEARSAAKVAHPGIVTVFECGQITDKKSAANGAAYIAMERLVGESLTDRLARSGRLAIGNAMEIVRQVASALEAAHKAGIVHRDLKPDNIFLVPDEAVVGGERVKVLDFGIAKLGRSASSSVQTQSMMVFGTPRYMSPEQCKSAAGVDHRSDIYTLGCILFELVCGQPPFLGAPGELIARHVLVEPPLVTRFVPDAPPALVELVSSLLGKEPDDRPQSMAAVQRALEGSGALAPGVAPTLAPDAVDIARSTGGGAAVVSPSMSLATEVELDPNPTTLGSAASSARVESSRRGKLGLVAGGLAIAVVAIVTWIVIGQRDDGVDPKREQVAVGSSPISTSPPPTPTPTPTPTPQAPGPVKLETVPPAPAKPSEPVKAPIAKPAAKPGVLVVSTKPACDVSIDGGPVQHAPPSLRLSAGRHRVVITNSELGISDTIVVDLAPGASKSIERDYSDRIKPKLPETKPETKSDSKDATINPFKGSAP